MGPIRRSPPTGGTSGATPRATRGRSRSWRIRRASGGAGFGAPMDRRNQGWTGVFLRSRSRRFDDGAACSSIPRARMRGACSGFRHRASVTGGSRRRAAGTLAAWRSGTMATAPVSLRGYMRSAHRADLISIGPIPGAAGSISRSPVDARARSPAQRARAIAAARCTATRGEGPTRSGRFA